MPSRTAEAEWKGKLLDGKGHIKVGSGSFQMDRTIFADARATVQWVPIPGRTL